MDDSTDKKHNQALYRNKLILGPMVRIGTLPMRLLALHYGADLVYTEEIIDFKLIKSHRFVNDILGTIDFVDDSGVVVFRTCELEKEKVILQIGTNDPSRAVLAAKMVENDVAGIDINMGCPKSFSLKGGMGAALLYKPDVVQNIIRSLKANIQKPISCKIRVFDNLNSTINLVKLIEEAGANAIAIHGRTKEERPKHSNRNDYIRAASNVLKIPVVANGDSSHINCFEDIKIFQSKTHSSSVMISRSAMKNCSIFDSTNKVKDLNEVIKEYLKLAIKYDNNAINTKYCIQQMLGSLQEYGKGKLLMGVYDLKAISDIYELGDYYRRIFNRWISKKNQIKFELGPLGNDHIELPVVFEKTVFDLYNFPKTILNKWITENNLENPEYQTNQIEKQFSSVVRFMGKSYSTPYLEKNKKSAEQSAALVIIFKHGLCDDSKVIETCLLNRRQNSISTIEHRHQGRTYLIKVNK